MKRRLQSSVYYHSSQPSEPLIWLSGMPIERMYSKTSSLSNVFPFSYYKTLSLNMTYFVSPAFKSVNQPSKMTAARRRGKSSVSE